MADNAFGDFLPWFIAIIVGLFLISCVAVIGVSSPFVYSCCRKKIESRRRKKRQQWRLRHSSLILPDYDDNSDASVSEELKNVEEGSNGRKRSRPRTRNERPYGHSRSPRREKESVVSSKLSSAEGSVPSGEGLGEHSAEQSLSSYYSTCSDSSGSDLESDTDVTGIMKERRKGIQEKWSVLLKASKPIDLDAIDQVSRGRQDDGQSESSNDLFEMLQDVYEASSEDSDTENYRITEIDELSSGRSLPGETECFYVEIATELGNLGVSDSPEKTKNQSKHENVSGSNSRPAMSDEHDANDLRTEGQDQWSSSSEDVGPHIESRVKDEENNSSNTESSLTSECDMDDIVTFM